MITPILTLHNHLRSLHNPARRIHPPRRRHPRPRRQVLLATPRLGPLRQRRMIPVDVDVVFLLFGVDPAAVQRGQNVAVVVDVAVGAVVGVARAFACACSRAVPC